MCAQSQVRTRRSNSSRRPAHAAEHIEPLPSTFEAGSAELALLQWTALWKSVMKRHKVNMDNLMRRKRITQEPIAKERFRTAAE
jgi:hypothetical protein